MVDGNTLEEKLEKWKKQAEGYLTDEIRHLGEVDYTVEVSNAEIVEYD